MPRLILIFFAVIFASSASSQVKISGFIRDSKGLPIRGASIAIKDSYDGATSDSLGIFQFETIEKGNHLVTISMIGYKELTETISIGSQPLELKYTLKEEINELTAVTITAGSFEASDTKRTTVLNSIDIVTTASANADVTSAIRTLPGAQQVGENEGLFVRGGTAQETKIFIDGTLVNNFFLSSVPDLAQRGRFSPFLFKGTVFSAGGYSALYGGALSSALILESIDFPEQSSASVGLSTVGANAGFQKLSKDKRSSWGIAYSYAHLGLYFALVKQRPDNFKIPAFHNADFNFRVKTSKTGILKFYGYFNYSQLGIRRPDIDSMQLKNAFGLTNTNLYANLSWKEKLGEHWKLSLGSGFSTNTDDINNQIVDGNNQLVSIADDPYASKNFDLVSKGKLATLKAVLERRITGISTLRFGAEYLHFIDNNNFNSKQSGQFVADMTDRYSAGFAETDIYVTNNLAAKLGARVEHSSILEKWNIVPRISMAYKVGPVGQVSLAYGIFYQKPEKEFFMRDYSNHNLMYTKATHYIANYQKVTRDYTLRAELFYKKYDDLVKTFSRSQGLSDSLSNTGYGEAKGFELFWRDRKTIRNLDYWISYSYLDTKRDYLNYPYAIRPNFAATHTANLVLKKFVSKLKTQFNASYTFATGRPYYNIRKNDNSSDYTIRDQGKTIPYHSMSVSVNYLPSIGKQGAQRFTVIVFSLNNVLGSDQIFGYNYSANGMRKDPILPAARRFFFLGCFISFGVDRSEDVINSNL